MNLDEKTNHKPRIPPLLPPPKDAIAGNLSALLEIHITLLVMIKKLLVSINYRDYPLLLAKILKRLRHFICKSRPTTPIHSSPPLPVNNNANKWERVCLPKPLPHFPEILEAIGPSESVSRALPEFENGGIG